MQSSPPNNAFNNLRRFVRRNETVEHCELCSAELAPEHQHLLEPANRKLVCSCDACAILFSSSDAKYRRVPRNVKLLENFRMDDMQWDSLMIPINMAFFFDSSVQKKTVVLYPSPAGPTESLLPLDSWTDILELNPILKTLETDTEALLVNRVQQAEYYIVPIDKCYELTGLMRAYWRGLAGGTEVWEKIQQFFAQLKQRAIVVRDKSDQDSAVAEGLSASN
jgi:hypothetical protein